MNYSWIRKYWIYIIVVAALLVAGGVFAWMQPKTVQVMNPVERQMPVRISHEANITALHKASVEKTVTGPVTTFTVKGGVMG